MMLLNNLKDILRSRYIIKKLTQKEFTTKYKNSFLGFLWTFLNPFLMMMVYVLVFSYVLRIRVDNYPTFLLAALVPWTFTQTAISSSTRSLVDNANLLKKIYFPREIIPLAVVLSNAISFLISMVLLFGILVYFNVYPTLSFLLLLLAFSIQFVFVLGSGLLLSAMYIRIRDVRQVLDVFFRFWFYLTPIIYPIDFVPKRFQTIYKFNPMVGIVNFYRDILLGTSYTDYFQLIYSSLFSALILILGMVIFGYRKKHFADWV